MVKSFFTAMEMEPETGYPSKEKLLRLGLADVVRWLYGGPLRVRVLVMGVIGGQMVRIDDELQVRGPAAVGRLLQAAGRRTARADAQRGAPGAPGGA